MHGIESIRQPYGFGSFVSKAFKKVGKGIKKVIKSPIGKMALLGGLGYLATPGTMGCRLMESCRQSTVVEKTFTSTDG